MSGALDRFGPEEAPVLFELADGRVIRGDVDEGFGPVADRFVDNFRHRGDLGSGCTVHVDGRLAVDVWGGVADARSGRPWTRDTPAVIFSCSKGVLALCAYLLVQDGRLDLDTPVAAYWPEFGQQGKEAITVREAMSHRAGVHALDRDLTRSDVLAWDPVIAAIEAQRPLFSTADGFAYHPISYGWLVGEIIRRITGETPGRYFAHRVAEPLGLDTWIGLPSTLRSTVAWMAAELPDDQSVEARLNAKLFASDPVLARSVTMGGAFDFPSAAGHVTFNDEDIQAAEIPAANGISSAPSLAKMYAACIGSLKSSPLLEPTSIRDALVARSEGQQITGVAPDGARWGTGFQLASPPTQPMLGPTSFGHAGAGGQLAFADVDHAVGFAYLSNQMGGYGDTRARQLTLALRVCLVA
jgi:CubicO group peptidase (beta-lactamase class C family)